MPICVAHIISLQGLDLLLITAMAKLTGTTTSKKKKVPSKQVPKTTPKKNTKTTKPESNAKQLKRSPKSKTLAPAATSGAKSPSKSASRSPKHTVRTSASTPTSTTSSLSTKSSSRSVTSSIRTAARKLKLDDDGVAKSPASKIRKKNKKIEADETLKLPSANSISWLNESELDGALQCAGVSLTDLTLQDKVERLATEYTPSALKLVYLTIAIGSGRDTRGINFDKMGARVVLTKMLVDLIVDMANMKPLSRKNKPKSLPRDIQVSK